jgi:prepilin-type N-terminal cleavage/methylation domain-containing protein
VRREAFRGRRGPGRRRLVRAFTLVEVSLVVIIIGVIAALSFVLLARVIKGGREAGERQMLFSLRTGIEQFRNDFGFLPPLVNDVNPSGPVDSSNNPRVRDNRFLRYETFPAEQRYSVYSIPYYLLGVLGTDVDGVDGPGYTDPQSDGSFKRRGRRTDPKLDIAKNPARLRTDPADMNRVVLLDRWQNPIRYYRWQARHIDDNTANTGQVDQYFVPRVFGDPNEVIELRDATYGLASLGADGTTDERKPLEKTGRGPDPGGGTDNTPIDRAVTKDDIVEVGR